jgi:hypothetical protein
MPSAGAGCRSTLERRHASNLYRRSSNTLWQRCACRFLHIDGIALPVGQSRRRPSRRRPDTRRRDRERPPTFPSLRTTRTSPVHYFSVVGSSFATLQADAEDSFTKTEHQRR